MSTLGYANIEVTEEILNSLVAAMSLLDEGSDERASINTFINKLREKCGDEKIRWDGDRFPTDTKNRKITNEATQLIRNGNSAATIKFIKENVSDLDNWNSAGHTLASVAAFNGDLEILKFLAENDADIFKADHHGALIFSLFASMNFEVLEWASQFEQFDAASPVTEGYTPLCQCLQNLVKRNDFGMVCGYNWHLIPEKMLCVEKLIEMGADINHVNAHGRTALINAVFGNAYEIVMLLLEHNADTKIRCVKGKDAKDYAIDNDDEVLLEVLTQFEAGVAPDDIRVWVRENTNIEEP